MKLTNQMQTAIWITIAVVLLIIGLLAIPFGPMMLNILVIAVIVIGLGWGLYGMGLLWARAVKSQKKANVYRTGGSRYDR